MTREQKQRMGMEALLEQVVGENAVDACRGNVDTTGQRFGCGARNERERRACSLFLWLLGPTTEQLSTSCPCQN